MCSSQSIAAAAGVVNVSFVGNRFQRTRKMGGHAATGEDFGNFWPERVEDTVNYVKSEG